MSRKVIDICEQPLQFKYGVAYCTSFRGRIVKVIYNNTIHSSKQYGYMIIDDVTHNILKYCRACSSDAIKKAVILN